MRHILPSPDSLRPFVTRSLRGPRLRRTMLASVITGVLTLLMGWWLAAGPGDLERGMRQAFDLERSTWERERVEYIVFADNLFELRDMRRAAQGARAGDPEHYDYPASRVYSAMSDAEATLLGATSTHPPSWHRARHEAASTMARDLDVWDSDRGADYFSWEDPECVERLDAILASDGVPTPVLYASPLTAQEQVRVVGGVAATFLLTLLLIVAPIMAGTQLAQEVHENTLTPLTGTALRPRELVVGLAAGPLAAIAIVAAPQVPIVLATAAASGYLLAAVGLVLVAVVGGLLLTALAQILGLGLGSRWAPAVSTAAMVALFGMAGLMGWIFGVTLNDDTHGVVAILPQAGAVHLMREAFFPTGRLTASEAMATDVALLAGSLGALVLGGLAVLALERRIERRFRPALTRLESLVGMVVASVLTCLVVPWHERATDADGFFMAGLAIAAFPMLALFAGRIPVGDRPLQLRHIPVARLLGELAVMVGIFTGVALLFAPDPEVLNVLHPASLFHTAWAFAVAGLVAIRAASTRVSIPGFLWLGVCGVMVFAEYVQGAVWAVERGHMEPEHFLAFTAASPVLGMVQLVLLVWVPISLLRPLRRAST